MRHLNVAILLKAVTPTNQCFNDRGRPAERRLPIHEVHAEGHFRRRRYTIKMLLSGHLVGKEFSLTDQKRSPARFFLFGEGKILWRSGRFCPQPSSLTTLYVGTAVPGCPAERSSAAWAPSTGAGT